jgi:hypothetical protein
MILPETVAVSSITSFMVPRSSRSMIVGPYGKGAADWVSNSTVILAHLVDLVPGDHMAEGLGPRTPSTGPEKILCPQRAS